MAKLGKILMPLAVLTGGLAAGGGTAYATALFLGLHKQPAKIDTVFVPTGPVLAPLVFPDGRLAGYVQFQVEVEVDSDKGEDIKARIPLLLDAINMRTYRTPMASGPDGMLPSLTTFRTVVDESAKQAFGPGVVHKAVITQAQPV